MEIGDWKVTIQKDVSFKTIPGNPNSDTQRMVTYDFEYVPRAYHIVRTLHYLHFLTDEFILETLTTLVGEMKIAFIDPLNN